MSEDTLKVILSIKAHTNKMKELRSVLTTLSMNTRQEPGCLEYKFLQNCEDPTEFTLIEEWHNDAALESHLTTRHFKEAISKLSHLIANKPDIRRYKMVREKGVLI